MDDLTSQTIKYIIAFIAVAIVLGTVGALALSCGVLIAGAVCFLVTGMIIGTLLGIAIANIDVGEG